MTERKQRNVPKKPSSEEIDYWVNSVSEGWAIAVRPLVVDLLNIPGLKLVQIKEKFGSLRVYYDLDVGIPTSDSDAYLADKLVNAAALRCDRMCEVCGKPGYLRTAGWVSVRCDEHYSH
jgi:hypothetical protein